MFKKLFVGGLPFIYSKGELEALFAGAGKIVSAEMVFDPDRGRTRGFGFVEMSTPEEALAAIAQLNGKLVGEKKIFVTEAREKKSSPPSTPGSPHAGKPPFRKVLNRKASRPERRPPTDYPSWPPRDARRSSFDGPGGSQAPGGSSHPRRGPSQPGSFGRPPSKGFSRPPKWEPRSDGSKSFSPPRSQRGDFGPSNRKPGASPSSRKPPKKEFWRKFQKKRPE